MDDEDVEGPLSAKCSRASSPTFSYFSLASSKVDCLKSSLIRKASLLNKREREFKPELTKEDTDFLTANTNYSQQQITKMFGEFIIDCPQGTLSVEKVKEMMNIILPDENGDIVANLIFSAFDKDNNGSLDFCEFMIATHCTANSSPEDKLHWVFQVYDTDTSGSITVGEIIQVFAALYDNEGLDQKFAVERAESVFGSLDVNHDGDVTEEEFVKVCMEDRVMVRLLREN